METTTKICSNPKCKKEKPIAEFNKRKLSKDGLKSICKKCHHKYEQDRIRTKHGVIRLIFNTQKQKSKKRFHNPPTYTLSQLTKWLFEETDYLHLYNLWVKSGYVTALKPSIDRHDDNLGYSFDNIRLVTWEINNKKGHFDRKNGINNKVSKPVIQMSIDGAYINKFYSINEAARITNISDANIIKNCKGIFKTAGGFIWKYYQEE